jgi:hypothetical protein
VQTGESGPFVWQAADEHVTRVAVEAGEVLEGRTLIRSGLKGGERLVIDPPPDLKDGQRVRIMP